MCQKRAIWIITSSVKSDRFLKLFMNYTKYTLANQSLPLPPTVCMYQYSLHYTSEIAEITLRLKLNCQTKLNAMHMYFLVHVVGCERV